MRKFSKWVKWDDRNNLPNIDMPGVYAIAVSDTDISGKEFSYIKNIAYFGMTNAKKGLKGRLKAFDNTIKNKTGHGGAARFRFEYINKKLLDDNTLERQTLENDLLNKLYVAVSPFNCDVTTHEEKDLRIMGEVAKAEYDCFADYVKFFGQLPQFNDMKKSPKK